ncbi:MAG: amidohydrolase family protein [Terriglobales bacterium]
MSAPASAPILISGARIALDAATSIPARILIAGSTIRQIPDAGEAVPLAYARRAQHLDLSGYMILPGLINAHEHLEFNLFPRLGRGPYPNFLAWAADIYQPDRSPVQEHSRLSKEVRCWWGGLKNLLCGVTTVCHHNPCYAACLDADFPVRVLRRYGWIHSLALGGDAAAAWRRAPSDAPFILHLAEGTDEASRQEAGKLDKLGVLDARTVAVHCVGLDADGHRLLRERRATLVWCPSSNLFMLGTTVAPDLIRDNPKAILGSDSALTAAGDLLDEMSDAAQVFGDGLHPRALLYDMVTRRAGSVLGLTGGIGRIARGGAADLIAVRCAGGMERSTPAELLVGARHHDVALVLKDGRVQLLAPELGERWSGSARNLLHGLEPLVAGGHERLVRAPVRHLLAAARQCLGSELRLGGKLLGSAPSRPRALPAAAGAVGAEGDPSDPHYIRQLPILVLLPHNRCNCRCLMCDIWRIRQTRELNTSDLDGLRNSLRSLAVRWVVLSGGEALMHSDLPALARILRGERVRLTLLSSGLLLAPRACLVADNVDDVIVSLDGPPAAHDQVRNVSGAYAHLARGIKALRDLRPGMTIAGRCTISQANFGCLRATVRSALELGLSSISFLAADLSPEAFQHDARPGGWSASAHEALGLTAEHTRGLRAEMDALVRECAPEIASGYIVEGPAKLDRLVRHFESQLGLAPAVAPRCNAPWVSAVVESDGQVRPCFFHAPLGNIRQQPLLTILNSPEALSFRRTLDVGSNPICRRCVCSLYVNAGADPGAAPLA